MLFGRAGWGGGNRTLASDTGVGVVVGFILCCLVVAWLRLVRLGFTHGARSVPWGRWGDEARMAMHANNISPRAEFVTFARCALTRIGWTTERKGTSRCK